MILVSFWSEKHIYWYQCNLIQGIMGTLKGCEALDVISHELKKESEMDTSDESNEVFRDRNRPDSMLLHQSVSDIFAESPATTVRSPASSLAQSVTSPATPAFSPALAMVSTAPRAFFPSPSVISPAPPVVSSAPPMISPVLASPPPQVSQPAQSDLHNDFVSPRAGTARPIARKKTKV